MTDTDDTIIVKYEGNADPSVATAAITFHADPDRRDIAIGGIGRLSREEMSRLQGLGYRLTPVEDDLKGLNKDKLQEVAQKEGVSIADSDGNELKVAELADAIWAARAAAPPAVEELPPSATPSPVPAAAGAGSAAGPGGAGGSGDAGGGPATTGTTGGGA